MCWIVSLLVIIGALNWGLVGLGGFLGKDLNVVHWLLGAWPTVEWIVYLVVGVCALVMAGLYCGKDHCECTEMKK